MNINSNNEIKIDGSNNRVYIGSKEKFEPMIDWLKKITHFKVKSAEKRYAPNFSQYHSLNIPNPSFKHSIDLLTSFDEVRKLLLDNIDEIINLQNMPEITEVKNAIRTKLSTINETNYRNRLSEIKSILVKTSALIEEVINRYKMEIENSETFTLTDPPVGMERKKLEFKIKEKYNKYRSVLHRLDKLIHFLQDSSFNIFEKKVILLTGEALIGKTHLFCDTALNRLQENKPTLLFFGNSFSSDKTIISNMISSLGIINCSENEFLEALDKLGKECGNKTLLTVDAINETKDSDIWRNGITEFCSKIKSYQNLALALSIRDVDRNKLETNNNEEYIANEIVEIEHKGFKGMELEAVQAFCNALGVETPKVPMHSLRLFVNPGMLFLYIETIKNTTQKIDTTIINPTTIFRTYLARLNRDFSQKYSLDEDDNIVEEAIGSFVSLGTTQDYVHFYIEQKTVSKELKKIHPEILQFLKSEGVINKLSHKGEVSLYFTYQKFENFFIAEHLLKNYEAHKATIFSLLKNHYGAISEALMVQLPEKLGKEIFELNIWLLKDKYVCREYINSLIWRHPSTITEQTFKYVHFIVLRHGLIANYFDVVLQLSTFPNHSLNMKRLHKSLFEADRSLREYDWSTYIHTSSQYGGIIKRIVEWAWDKDRLFEISDESLYLYGLTLSWFLTSSNRVLRDSATKALVNIFTDKIDIFLSVLGEFKNVDDLYITERLYAVAYGITLRSFREIGFKELAEYIYSDIFDVENVIEHILIRDYAKLTIEYIASKISLGIDISKASPPYRSKIPSQLPSDKEIDDLEALSSRYKQGIISSMITEQGRNKKSWYGDFGRYKFQSELQDFNLKKIRYQDLSNYAVKIIFDELIKDDRLFELTEMRLNATHSSRYEHAVERLGKKYQWIAFYKVLAKVADSCKVRDYSAWKDKHENYKGAYQIGIRNIDPTTILKNKKELDKKYWSNINNDFEDKRLSDIK